MPDVVVPDITEPILAWRWMDLSPRGTILGTMGKEWVLDTPFEAECNEGCGQTPSSLSRQYLLARGLRLKRRSDHLCGFGCGIYAYKRPPLSPLDRHPYNWSTGAMWPVNILVSTYLWGRVYEHTNGYRAQYGQICQMYYPHRYHSGVQGPDEFLTKFTRRPDIIERITFLHTEDLMKIIDQTMT